MHVIADQAQHRHVHTLLGSCFIGLIDTSGTVVGSIFDYSIVATSIGAARQYALCVTCGVGLECDCRVHDVDPEESTSSGNRSGC